MNARIRLATPDDAAAVQAIYAPFCDDTTVSFETAAPEVVHIGNRIRLAADHYPWLVCDVDDVVIGYAYASAQGSRAAFAWTVEVAIYIRADFRGKSVGRALYASLFAVLRAQKYVNALAAITSSNTGSITMHQRCGFTLAGRLSDVGFKLGTWLSLDWMQYQLLPLPAVPEPLLKLSQLSTSQIAAAFEAGESILRTRHSRG